MNPTKKDNTNLEKKNELPVNHDSSLDNKKSDFPIVGIGCSAGGLEAMEVFFRNMPPDSGMAFVIIQHLDPSHKGLLPEILQRTTAMNVLHASERLRVKPNHVYVIPSNKTLSILNGILHLLEPTQSRGFRLPIDIFFRSLAADQLDKCIGIILSGMGSDGSLGIKSIKEKNGLVLVQDPNNAKFDSMPKNAIESVNVDIVATAEELPERLISLLKYIPPIQLETEIDDKTRNSLDKIIILLREQTGHDFLLYKKNTLLRRIERRKGIHQIEKIQNYVRFLQENPKEIELLFKELLIGVTGFFRDAAVWEKLRDSILPELIKELPNGHVLRAWVTACSTGEEAYSLAIVMKEAFEKTGPTKNLTFQIFATDLDIDAIEKARRGIFSSSIAIDVSPERINNYFTTQEDGYRINASIREMLVFAPHDIIKDPPFTKLDILTCRNMLIYMEPPLQKKLIALFNYSLNPNGILVLGSAETLGRNNSGFDIIDSRLKIFKRNPIAIIHELTDFPSSFSRNKIAITEMKKTSKAVDNIQTIVDQILLQRFVPASVLVNDKGDILYITGKTGKYLEPVAGKANWNIHAMARDGLKHELLSAFHKSTQSFEPITIKNLKINANEITNSVNITIQRFDNPDSLKGMILIVFTEVLSAIETSIIDSNTSKQYATSKQKKLEGALKQSNDILQSTREEMQTSQEELKSTNEELQSTNEELTTSKEEMQSLNEELQTVNAELQSKLSEFEQANNDMKNLLNSTEIATLFLDKELNIRRYTDPVTKIFKLRTTDTGRPFTDLVTELDYPEMGIHVHQVIKNLTSIQNTIPTRDGKWFYVRIMPYRTLDDRIDGIVITFTDITAAKQAEERLVSEKKYRRLFESAKDGILILDAQTGKIIDVNPFLIELLGYTKEQFIEKAIWEIGSLKDIVANKDKFKELQQIKFVRYENLPLETADGKKINVEFVSNAYLVNNNKVFQCIIRDISDRKLIEDNLRFSDVRYRHLFESAKDGIFFLDPNTGKIIDINPFLIELIGYSKEKLTEKEVWKLDVFRDIIPNEKKFSELKKKEFVCYPNLTVKTESGKTINIEFNSNMYSEKEKAVIQCFIHENKI